MRYVTTAWSALRTWLVPIEIRLFRHRRLVAAATAVGLHILIVALLVMDTAVRHGDGGPGGANSGSGGGYSIELVAADTSAVSGFKVKPPASADRLAFTPLQTTSALAALPTADAAPTLPAPAQPAGSENTPDPAAASGAAGTAGRRTGANDDLWKQIEPCWRRLADRTTQDITLRIDFSPLGNVARTSNADAGASDAQDPRSQATAVAALAQCGPYVGEGSQQAVIVTFPKP